MLSYTLIYESFLKSTRSSLKFWVRCPNHNENGHNYLKRVALWINLVWWMEAITRTKPKRGVPPWSNNSLLNHRSLPPVFESRHRHIWRVFYLWLRFITFGGHSAHLAYHVQKNGPKTCQSSTRSKRKGLIILTINQECWRVLLKRLIKIS